MIYRKRLNDYFLGYIYDRYYRRFFSDQDTDEERMLENQLNAYDYDKMPSEERHNQYILEPFESFVDLHLLEIQREDTEYYNN